MRTLSPCTPRPVNSLGPSPLTLTHEGGSTEALGGGPQTRGGKAPSEQAHGTELARDRRLCTTEGSARTALPQMVKVHRKDKYGK